MSEPLFGHIDGNSFYCSCERAFQPALRRKPVVVLSNNDGCAISRTREAKALGVRMGEPYHLARKRPELADIAWYSSNYALYGDLSRRFYLALSERVPRVEPYSIDEMFLDLTGLDDIAARCAQLRQDIHRILKLPTCIGWGPTKTIAKLANRIAKNDPDRGGLCDLTKAEERARCYARLSVEDIWGIGRRHAKKLNRLGVRTVADFAALDPRQVRRLFTVIGERTYRELHGISCLSLSEAETSRKSLATTRTFGRILTQWPDLREAVVYFAESGAAKLRREKLLAGRISVFVQTNPHGSDPWYANQRSVTIEPSNHNDVIVSQAVDLLQSVWKNGIGYFKAGVILTDFSPQGSYHTSLFSPKPDSKKEALMTAYDAINAKYGRGTVRMTSTTLSPNWTPRRNMMSQHYTTRLDELYTATAW